MKHGRTDGRMERTPLRSTERCTRVRIGKLVARCGGVLPHIGWLRPPFAIARTINHDHFTKHHLVRCCSHVMFVIAAICTLIKKCINRHRSRCATLLPCMHITDDCLLFSRIVVNCNLQTAIFSRLPDYRIVEKLPRVLPDRPSPTFSGVRQTLPYAAAGSRDQHGSTVRAHAAILCIEHARDLLQPSQLFSDESALPVRFSRTATQLSLTNPFDARHCDLSYESAPPTCTLHITR